MGDLTLLRDIDLLKRKVIYQCLTNDDIKYFAEILKDIVWSNVYIFDGKGSLLAQALSQEFECNFTDKISKFLFEETKTKANLVISGIKTSIIPMLGGDIRVGTMLIARLNKNFGMKDIILAELVAAVTGNKLMKAKDKQLKKEIRQDENARQAIKSLTYNEFEVVKKVLNNIQNSQGKVKICRIASEVGISRSRTSGALTKLESAGVVESCSLGTNGTYVKLKNPCIIKYINDNFGLIRS
ncbi:hypothetical protein [Natranaerofaba carboxydovora]|uniref:hypothetical protein n=1 Tax=Natranaerofaba carboxydovora TaxID=2742683 RepID=UPI001F133CEB|nr:hypothetical protein [Natranaerofaba carboxydovora]UMZ74283.1 GTP-sensing transcriptional pleiotropic repressor CodY [Natranaerofaba carboxydovora]